MSRPRRCVAKFARLMESVLRDNDHKSGWQTMGFEELLSRIIDEVRELDHTPGTTWGRGPNFFRVKASEVRKECADIANFAMMIADLYGKLMGPTMTEQPTDLPKCPVCGGNVHRYEFTIMGNEGELGCDHQYVMDNYDYRDLCARLTRYVALETCDACEGGTMFIVNEGDDPICPTCLRTHLDVAATKIAALWVDLEKAREALEGITFMGTDPPPAIGSDEEAIEGFYGRQLRRCISIAANALTSPELGDDARRLQAHKSCVRSEAHLFGLLPSKEEGFTAEGTCGFYLSSTPEPGGDPHYTYETDCGHTIVRKTSEEPSGECVCGKTLKDRYAPRSTNTADLGQEEAGDG